MRLAERLRRALENGARTGPLLVGDDIAESLRLRPEGHWPAAMLVPVVDRPDPGVILTLRAEDVRRHAGQISFPGGRIDPDDDGPVAAALREAEEEVGLPRSQVEVVGVADPYHTITGFEVTPVLGVVPPDLPLRPQPQEVAAIFEAPLSFVLDPKNQVVRTVHWQGRERTYYEIEWEGWRIWGATAAMIVNLGRRLALS